MIDFREQNILNSYAGRDFDKQLVSSIYQIFFFLTSLMSYILCLLDRHIIWNTEMKWNTEMEWNTETEWNTEMEWNTAYLLRENNGKLEDKRSSHCPILTDIS